MKFGSISTTKPDGDDETKDIDRYHDGGVTSQYKQYKQRHIVTNAQEETKLYLRFSEDIAAKRNMGILVEINDEPSTRPSICFDFSPKYKGGYMVITTWTERV